VPGNLEADMPEKDEGLEIIFFRFLLPQAEHSGWYSEVDRKISLCLPQSWQR
jgi:hypothetical protein